MHRDEVGAYVCPETIEPLILEVDEASGDEVIKGALVSAAGDRFPISNGIPDLRYPAELAPSDQEALDYYELKADEYDECVPLTFQTFSVDETEVRNDMVDRLALEPSDRVLEFGCGTGRDSELIARRLDDTGKLYLQDLSPSLLAHARERMSRAAVPIELSIANGCYPPFPDRFFDAVFHFGGFSTFSDIPRALAEAARVTKVGGKVVIGAESMPPWLRSTEFAKILMNSNPLYRCGLPLEHVPVCAREVNLSWILGGVFYVIDFVVGEGEPQADFDFEIPGPRGGTHRTRYDGHLEGVSPESVRLAREAREKSGLSMHDWLNEAIRLKAEADLGGESK